MLCVAACAGCSVVVAGEIFCGILAFDGVVIGCGFDWGGIPLDCLSFGGLCSGGIVAGVGSFGGVAASISGGV